MNKDEIQKKIYELKSEDEIIEFVKSRLNELESNSEEKKVGQGYTYLFQEYISEKVHYKAGASFEDAECPDLIYDDITPYVELIKSVREASWYNELSLFSTVFFTVYNYLPSEDIGLGRALTYMSHKNERVSIKTIRENGCAFCSEKAGMAHNLFKFLGIDSEVACGYRDSEMHAFNMIYPNGYGSEPMVIYDPSFFVSFVRDNQKSSFGYFKALRRDDYEKLINGEQIKIDLTKTEENYRKLYGYNGSLDDAVFEGEEPTYSIGVGENREVLPKRD